MAVLRLVRVYFRPEDHPAVRPGIIAKTLREFPAADGLELHDDSDVVRIIDRKGRAVSCDGEQYVAVINRRHESDGRGCFVPAALYG
jgi:hypothetical protein